MFVLQFVKFAGAGICQSEMTYLCWLWLALSMFGLEFHISWHATLTSSKYSTPSDLGRYQSCFSLSALNNTYCATWPAMHLLLVQGSCKNVSVTEIKKVAITYQSSSMLHELLDFSQILPKLHIQNTHSAYRQKALHKLTHPDGKAPIW